MHQEDNTHQEGKGTNKEDNASNGNSTSTSTEALSLRCQLLR